MERLLGTKQTTRKREWMEDGVDAPSSFSSSQGDLFVDEREM